MAPISIPKLSTCDLRKLIKLLVLFPRKGIVIKGHLIRVV
jgi:hypothetical protein